MIPGSPVVFEVFWNSAITARALDSFAIIDAGSRTDLSTVRSLSDIFWIWPRTASKSLPLAVVSLPALPAPFGENRLATSLLASTSSIKAERIWSRSWRENSLRSSRLRILDIAIALRAASASDGEKGVLFSAELAQIKPGLIIINIIAKVKIDAALRLSVFNFTNSPVGHPRSPAGGRDSRR